jgi:hypothetical protein
MPKPAAYALILHIMSGLLIVGFIANLMVRPVEGAYWMAEEPEEVMAAAH